MNKTAILPSLFVGLLVGVSATAHAGQRKHRPWFSHAASAPAEAEPVVQRIGPRDKGDTVAQQAIQYKGTRYRWGGSTKRGLDCSGLVNRVWEDLKMKK